MLRKPVTLVPYLLWVSSIVFYAMGLYYPLLATRSQIFGFTIKQQEVRLFDSINLFYNSNEIALAAIIFAFTIVLPIAKYIELAFRITKPLKKGISNTRWLQVLDKWSMLDVFIVALLLMNFKLNSTIIVMQLLKGTTFLAISIILRMGVAVSWDLLKSRNV